MIEKESNPDAFNAFFEQSKLRAFFFKKSEVNGDVYYSIHKKIVEIIIRDMLFDENKLISGDIAMKAFVPVTNESEEIIFYTVHIKNKLQFNYVIELLSTVLSFRQISKVVKSNRENLGTAAKVGCISPGEASNFSRLTCVIGLQAMVEIMRSCWALSIGADESNDKGLASVMPTSSRVEADFFFMNFCKDEYSSNLSDYSLERIMFECQLKQLDFPMGCIYD
ncbi:hypothetical protein AXG93_154s1010 [Marchantia polymorpha subsp. ruderalis]|uniref:Uncharacterized protein n=1 Tax=Marchantia polymorpha subsp. ruderalis TaxID=1480154 RepID=A0A176VJ75_MARPO|nr:hypothetical protein AXG93_154s1010 [Marchantia polymorpha subsp. ruderalis]